MWFHDHRFFFTAQNVHKGMFALCNYYSGPDRGREDLNDGINLQLPRGSRLPWGNTDFDVNLAIANPAQDQAGHAPGRWAAAGSGIVNRSGARRRSSRPAVGPILEFRVLSSLQSVDNPAKTYRAGIDADRSANLNDAVWTTRTKTLTTQIPIVAPVRTREIEFGRSGNGDSLPCIPDCGDVQNFPWSIKINGQAAHTANANRISVLVPKPGEVEHWTLVNGGGGWDHPVHLHFEEGITINRGGAFIPSTELNVRGRLAAASKRAGHVSSQIW
jgi:hypothetical protein